jgi:hypothetical protein
MTVPCSPVRSRPRRLWRLGLPLPLLTVLALAFVAVAPAASAQGALRRAMSVRGTVVNSSHGDASVAGQAVTLVEVADGQSANIATATTDAHGAFAIANLSLDADATYQLEVPYEGGNFTSSAFDATQLGAQSVVLHVFDTTSDDSTVLVALTTLVLDEPKVQAGLISVAEGVTVYNTGLKAYVATLQPTGDKPMNLLRFSLPAGATNLVLGAGFATVQVVQAATGFGVTATIPPGSTEFAFAYDLPYRGTVAAISTRTEYTSRQIVALVPSDLHLAAGDFVQRPGVDAAGGHFQVLEQDNVAPDRTLSFGLHNLPVPGEPQYLNGVAMGVLGLVLALVLLGTLALYLRRGELAPLLGVAHLPAPRRVDAVAREAARKTLLRQHLVLDERHGAGSISGAEYARQRAVLRGRLGALAADEGAVAGADPGGASRRPSVTRRGARVAPRLPTASTAPAKPTVPATPGGAS